MTMGPFVVSITIAFCLSRLAGSGCAKAGTANISAATRPRILIMTTPDQRKASLSLQPANLVLRLAATDCGTKADTSPPIAAI